MIYTQSEFLDYIRDNDVKFVKLTFCDMLGRQRNISVLSSQLDDAFHNGVSIDSSAMTGVGGVDLKLRPVSSLLSVLPWRPHAGRVVSVFCNIFNLDGTPYCCDPMVLLEKQVNLLSAHGLKAKVGTECEFYVFKDEPDSDTIRPFDLADYCACAPYDKCENIRRDVIVSLEDMGLKPISSHHERGNGQNEVDFESADPLSAARNFIMFKAAVKNVCEVNGTRASFMPKPMADQFGSGLHLSVTLSGDDAERKAEAFTEGVMTRYKEITCFANPTHNSYERLSLVRGVTYSENRSRALRIFKNNGNTVVQLRTPDSTCNIFEVLALVFAAGREGIEKGLKLRKPDEKGFSLFSSIDEAIEFAEKSDWLHENIPVHLDEVLGTMKRRCAVARGLKTEKDVFEFYMDI